MTKSYILIDFDHTLFDTESFKKALATGNSNEDYSKFVYPDSIDFINYAKKFGTPVLFSEGEVEFQKEKIRKGNIEKHFGRNIKIFKSFSKIKTIAKDYLHENTILIDDRPEIIDQALKKGIKCIRVRRGKYKDVIGKTDPAFTVSTLTEVIKKDLFMKF